MFAHRGGFGPARRNTLGAFRAALRTGARGLESDVRVSADGVPVLLHGARVRRGPVASLPRSALPRWLPTLAELYAACGAAFELSLDVRAEDAAAVVATAAAAAALDRLWLCTGDAATAAAWRSRHPGVRVVLSADRLPDDLAGLTARLQQAGVHALNVPARYWTPATVEQCRERGLLAFGWAVHSRRTLRRATDAGCAAVYTDWRWLWRHGGHAPPAVLR